ncbi:MAG: PAS domain S-box protein [Desulfobacterales bacterium]|nr:PAS domain S-box protein [Desulfobacterales bacterium]
MPIKLSYEALEQRVKELEKNASEKTEETESRLKAFFEASSEAIFFSENGICIDQNPAAEKMFGYTLEEAKGRPEKDWIIPEDHDLFREKMHKLHSDPYQTIARRKDGSIFPCEIQAHSSTYQGQTVRVSTLKDISSRVNIEDSLCRQKDEYRQLADESPVSIMRFDSHGKITFVNKWHLKTIARHRYDASFFIGKKITELPGIVNAGVASLLAPVFDGKPVLLEDVYFPEFTGGHSGFQHIKAVPVKKNNQFLGGILLREDATLGNRAEYALKQSEERFGDVISSLLGAVFQLVQKPDGSMTLPFISHGACALFGKSLQDLQDISKVISAIHPDDVKKLEEAFVQSSRDMSVWAKEFRVCHNSESVKWLSGVSNPSKLDDGSVSWSGVLMDVTEKKEAEQALKESSQTIESIFRSAPTGIGVVSDRIIIQANELLEKMTGYPKEELIGQNARLLYQNDEDFEYVGREKYKQIRESGTGTVETKWKLKNGEIIDVLLSSTPIDFEDFTKGVTFTALDITTRKNAERALEFQALLLDQIQDHVTATDLEGNIVYVNEAILRTFKMNRADLINKPVAVYGEDASKGATQAEIIEYTLKYGAWRGEVVNYDTEGREYIVFCRTQLIKDKKGQPWRMVGISTDITDRKKSESERELLLTAIEQSPVTVVITDANGKIEYVNSAFEHLTGYTRQRLIGKNPRILKSGEHNPEFYQKLWTTISKGQTWKGNITNRKKDGSFYTEETTISPVWNKSGRIVNYVAVKRDITDELQMRDKLAQAQKMDTIGTLAGGIAHDFNNILFPILGHTEILLEELPTENTDAHESLKQIYASAKRARDLVQQILTFSRQEKVKYRPLQIQSVLDEVVKLLGATLPRNIEIQKTVEPDCRPIHADPTQVHQIIMNLSTNAYHAMEDQGGEIAFKVTSLDIQSQPGAESQLKPGCYICLSVKDSGIGMAPDVVEKIFDPFFTTKEKAKGTGMGLSVVHGIVENMGGMIKVRSRPGHGSEFRVYFPVKTVTASIDNNAAKLQAYTRGKENLIIVDDEEAILKMEAIALERAGYNVTALTDPVEALMTFKASPQKFDLVITDMSMPKMQGDSLVKEMRAVRNDIPIILCTGFSEKMTPELAKSIGINSVMMKPLVLKKLSERVRDILDAV